MADGEKREKTFTADEIDARLKAELPRWSYKGGSLCRTYKTQGWEGALMVANAVGHLAEAAWHHPELSVSYASVDVRLHTHDAGGVTAKDFELARKIEEIVLWRPGSENGALTGTPQDARHTYIVYE